MRRWIRGAHVEAMRMELRVILCGIATRGGGTVRNLAFQLRMDRTMSGSIHHPAASRMRST